MVDSDSAVGFEARKIHMYCWSSVTVNGPCGCGELCQWLDAINSTRRR